jgi:hypothetical protein
MAADTLGTLVPLLLVVVERFTSLVRDETADPADVVGSRPLLTPLSLLSPGQGDPDELGLLPRLGRLNVVHATNVVMLGSAFVLLVAADPSAVRNVLSLVVVIVLLQLPVLEVSGYDAVRDAGIVPVSLYWHVLGTGLTAALAFTVRQFEPGELLTSKQALTSGTDVISQFQEQFLGLVPVLLAVALVVGVFLKLLEQELLGAARAGDGDDTDLPEPRFSYVEPP